MKLKSFAKINLNLHILPKNKHDQFTPLILINHRINIFDKLEFVNQNEKIELICYPKNLLPEDETNLVFKSALKLKEFAGNPGLGAKITLHKNIPVTAGLAGSSSNAAITLQTLIKLWHIKIPRRQLLEMATAVGKDIPYFLSSNLCRLTRYGDLPHRLYLRLPKFYLVIIYPNNSQKPSTGWMFQHLNFSLTGKNLDKEKFFLNAVKAKNKKNILQNLHNDFETMVFDYFPETQQIVDDLISQHALNTLLSGSGLGIIGFFINKNTAQKAYRLLKNNYSKIFFTSTV